jgi:hypothetical protein
VAQLWEHLRATPWPALAGSVGDFALYDALLAGYASRAARGEALDPAAIPAPDDATIAWVDAVRTRGATTEDETALLGRFDLLEQIRAALTQERDREGSAAIVQTQAVSGHET